MCMLMHFFYWVKCRLNMEMMLLLGSLKQWTSWKLVTRASANSLHEFLEYQKCLQRFNEVENEHKDLLRQQRFTFVAKRLKEFDMANVRKIEAIKRDWNCLWHIISNKKCLPPIEKLELPWSHYFEEAEIIVVIFYKRKHFS